MLITNQYEQRSIDALQPVYITRNDQAHRLNNGSKVRGKNAPQYLDRGIVLGKKYRIEKMIGGGGFGQIYRATDIDLGTVVAAKVEPQSEDAGRMVLEQMVLTKLIGTRHSPRLAMSKFFTYASGWLNNYNFIVMQMLGRNLTELRKAQTERRFSVHTTVRIGIQVIEALKFVHDLGFLHRDVKPSNMCVGIGEHRRIIYLVDFGMTRQFRLQSGELRKERAYAAFRGTMRYVSLAVHERKEQGPVDDLWSVYYTLIELAEGSLPWRTITDHDEIFQMKRRLSFRELCRSSIRFSTSIINLYIQGPVDDLWSVYYTLIELAEGSLPWRTITDHDEIFQMKRRLSFRELCRYLPRHFEMFSILLRDLNYTSIPDYVKLTTAIKRCCKLVDDEADFEWDDEMSTQSH
ncbi:hypothetical protein DICVIV_06747 [Dictyocaulus viviparus]|uniref:non-specific serine/threonine protein kinase n=1 Tax=Dictyocaulus viviparus TaxID=29172 RepID=A0A0D8XTQ7_DICVI|nr:hypothetical protein DICVIV_06747 [Dictyocaulus viviparus]